MNYLTERTLITLAEPTRLRIIELLSERPRKVGDIAHALNMSGPATSRHLRVLRQGGLIEDAHPEADARVRVYQLRPEPFAELRAWAERIESLWTAQLGAFKDYAERTKEDT
jgi:DNA-binding transcriptional ArsR family regulator